MAAPVAGRPFGWRGLVLEPVAHKHSFMSRPETMTGRHEWLAEGVVLVWWQRTEQYRAWFGSRAGDRCHTADEALVSARSAALTDVAKIVRLAHLTK